MQQELRNCISLQAVNANVGFERIGRTAKFILSKLVDPVERFIGVFAKLRKGTISFVMSACQSVRPHRTTRYPLDAFS
jgi:hypothetical protein